MSDKIRETLETVAKVLFWSWILGLALLVISSAGVTMAGDLLHNMHSSWYGLSIRDSDIIIASYLALIKLCVLVLFFVPWLAIRVVLNRKRRRSSP